MGIRSRACLSAPIRTLQKCMDGWTRTTRAWFFFPNSACTLRTMNMDSKRDGVSAKCWRAETEERSCQSWEKSRSCRKGGLSGSEEELASGRHFASSIFRAYFFSDECIVFGEFNESTRE